MDRRQRALVRWEVRHVRSCQWLADGSVVPEFAPTESYEGVDDGVIRTVLRTSAPDGPVLAVRGAGVHVCGLHAIPTPLRALGRHLDLTGRPLGKVLRTAHDLRVASVHDSAGESIWTVDVEILPERLQGRAGRAWIDVIDAEVREILRIPVLWLRSL